MSTKGGKSVGKTAEKLQELGYEGATTAMQGKTLFDPKAKSVDVSFAKTTTTVPSSAVLSSEILVTTTPEKFKDVSMTLMPREDDVTRPIELENKAMVSKKMDDVPIDTSTAKATADDEKLAAYHKKMAAYEKDKELRKKAEIQRADFMERDAQARKDQQAREEQRKSEEQGYWSSIAVPLVITVLAGIALSYYFAKRVSEEPEEEGTEMQRTVRKIESEEKEE